MRGCKQIGFGLGGLKFPKYSGLTYLEVLDKMRKEDPEAYNRLLRTIAIDKLPNSEIVYYLDSKGNPLKVVNTGAGYLSGADPIGLMYAEGVVLGLPLKWLGNKIYRYINPTITLRMLKLIGDRVGLPISDYRKIRNAPVRNFAEYLHNLGVDISKFSEADLKKLLDIRMNLIKATHPSGKYVIVESDPYIPSKIDSKYYNDNKLIGEFSGLKFKDRLYAGEVQSYSPSSNKVYQSTMDGLIKYARVTGMKGLQSGDNLISANKTYNVWKHYPKKELVSKNGIHSNKNITGIDNTITDGDIYLISNPSSLNIPTKSFIFNPKFINRRGKFETDWSNPDLTKKSGGILNKIKR